MGELVFEGLHVVEFAWLAAGPFMDSFLAHYGATVIKIESSKRTDTLRTTPPFQENKPGIDRSGWFAKYNQNRYGITLNIMHPKSRGIVEKLIQWGDIVTESFAPGIMEKAGWSYDEISKIKPDIIMISASSQGQTGPRSRMPSYGMHLTSLAGFVHLTNWPDCDPAMVYGAYTDFIAPYFGIAALLAAMDYRHRTGEGQYIDLSQYECALQFLAPVLLDYEINNRIQQRAGNTDPYAAPHGVFRCHGEDEWCAIAVFTDEQWKSFCEVLSRPELTEDPKFLNLMSRKENEDELDRLVEEWTRKLGSEEVMGRMQNAGVPAGVVRDNEGVFLDPQLNHRRHFHKVNHPEMGIHTVEALPFKLSDNPYQLKRSSPCLGQDNFHVYTEILGIPGEEFVQLSEEGVFD